MEASIAAWITTVCSVISASAISLALWQIFLIRRHNHEDHQRSRQELAIELIWRWSSSLTRQTSSARKLVQALSDQQARALFEEQPLRVAAKHKHLIAMCLDRTDAEAVLAEQGDDICLPDTAVAAIRWQAMRYLNALETIMAAWKDNIADREIIEQQFSYLVSDKHDELKNLREAVGLDSFPGVEAFSLNRKPPRQPAPGRPRLGLR